MNLKKSRPIAFLLLFMAFAISSKGQESFNKISVSSGLAGSTLKDKVISTYIYKKKGIPVIGEYSYKGYKSFLGLRLYFLKSKLKTDENKGFSYSGDLGTFIPDKVNGLNQNQVNFLMFQTRAYYLARIHIDDRFSLGLGGFAQYDIINKKFLVLDYENKLKERLQELTPARLLLLTDEEMRACYVSRQKNSYLKYLAEAILSGHLNLEALQDMPDDEVRARLTALKGIGNWTADIYLIFVLQHPDVFPIGDLAAVNALKRVKNLPSDTTREQVLDVAAQWLPYRTIATMLLWHYYLSAPKKAPK